MKFSNGIIQNHKHRYAESIHAIQFKDNLEERIVLINKALLLKYY